MFYFQIAGCVKRQLGLQDVTEIRRKCHSGSHFTPICITRCNIFALKIPLRSSFYLNIASQSLFIQVQFADTIRPLVIRVLKMETYITWYNLIDFQINFNCKYLTKSRLFISQSAQNVISDWNPQIQRFLARIIPILAEIHVRRVTDLKEYWDDGGWVKDHSVKEAAKKSEMQISYFRWEPSHF